MQENEITRLIIKHAIEIHNHLGPGLLESAYKYCLFHSLKETNLIIEKEKAVPLTYNNIVLDCGYRADLVVMNKVIVEVKSIDAIHDIHLAQVLTYLKLSKCRLGLLINFNTLSLKDGIRRVVNGF